MTISRRYFPSVDGRPPAYPGGQAVLDKLANSLYPGNMNTSIAEKRFKILSFWKKHGTVATYDAFEISRSTLYRWQERFKEQERLEALSPKSRARRTNHQRLIDYRLIEEATRLRRCYPRLGKEKLYPLLKETALAHQLPVLSVSTIGRMLGDLKKAGRLPCHQRLRTNALSGRLHARTLKRTPKKRRGSFVPKEPGDLLQRDTIVSFINGVKRYTLTAIDLSSRFAFAWTYSSGSSKAARDFFQRLELVAPFAFTSVQTDNGSEFMEHFQAHLEEAGIIHFFNYPRRPQWNGTVERFNRTLQEEFLSYHLQTLADDLEAFNRLLSEWLLWYNSRRTHHSLKASPLDYLIRNHGLSHLAWTHTGC